MHASRRVVGGRGAGTEGLGIDGRTDGEVGSGRSRSWRAIGERADWERDGLAGGGEGAGDLQDPTLLFFVCTRQCFRILLDDRIRDRRELFRTFTVADEGGEDEERLCDG